MQKDFVDSICGHSVADGGKTDPWFEVEWMVEGKIWSRGSAVNTDFPGELQDYILENCNEPPYNKFLPEDKRKVGNVGEKNVALSTIRTGAENVVLPSEGLSKETGKLLPCDHGNYLDGGGYKREPLPFYCGPNGDLWKRGCGGDGCTVMWVEGGSSVVNETFRPSHAKPVYICRNRWAKQDACKHAICGPCWDTTQVSSVRSRRARS